jgi:hypothetical protein
MSICNLEENKTLANKIANHINLHIKNKIATGEPFKLLDIVNEIFSAVNKDSKDVNMALGIAGVVPKIFIELTKIKPEYISDLKKANKNFKMDPILDFQNEIETSDKPLDIVAKYIKKGNLPTIQQINNNSYGVEPVEKKILKQAPDLSTIITKALSSDRFNSTTGTNQVVKANDTTVPTESNPAKTHVYSTLQKLLSAKIKLNNATYETVKYSGHTGFKLKALKEGELPNPEKNVYSENKQSKSSIVAITDNKGEYLYFNDNGEITTEKEGKIVYLSLRKVSKESKANLVESALKQISKVISEEEFNTTRTSLVADINKKINEQSKDIEEINRQIANDEEVFLDITGGMQGIIEEGQLSTQKPLSEYKLSINEIQNAGKESKEYVTNGRTYQAPTIQFDNFDESVTLKGMKVSDANPALLKTLVDLIVDDVTDEKGDVIPIKEKIEKYLYQFGKPSGLKPTEVGLFIKNKALDLSNKVEAKKELTDFLKSSFYFTYVNTTLSKRNLYNAISVTDNVLKVQEAPYRDFIFQYLIPRVIYDQTKVDGQPIARPMVNNGYFTFERTDLKEVAEKEAKSAVSTANDVIENANYDIDELSDLLERSKLIESNATPEQIAAGDAWAAEAAIFKVEHKGKPVLTVKDARNIVNSDAFATFANATITLYKGADSTHMYHEAWHAFSQMYLPKAKRDKLYSDASKLDTSFSYIKKIGGPGGNNTQKVTIKLNELDSKNKNDRKILEEFIAEEFRLYAMNNGEFRVKNEKTSILKQIFDKIWALLKALFKGEKISSIYSNPGSAGVFTEMFNKLYTAKSAEQLNMFKPSMNNAEFGTLNNGVISEDGTVTLSELESTLLSKSIDGIISDITTQLLTSETPKYGAAMQIFSSPKILDKLYNVTIKKALTNRLTEMTENYKKNEASYNKLQKDYYINNIRILKDGLEAYGDINKLLSAKTSDNSLVAYHLQNSAFKDVIRESIQDPTDIDETNPKDLSNLSAVGAIAGNALSSEKHATANAMYILQSLVKQEYKNGQRINKLNQLGFPETVQFKPLWSFLMNKVSGQQNIQDLYTKLLEAQKTNASPLIDQLLEKLGDPSVVTLKDKVAADIWLGVTRSFSLSRVDLINTMFEETTDKNTGEVFITATSGKVSADYFNIKNIWNSRFSTAISDYIKINKDKENTLKLDAISNKFLINYTDSDGIKRYKLNPTEDSLKFLESIGVYMSDNYEVREAIDDKAMLYIADAIGQAASNGLEIKSILKFFNNSHPIQVEKFIDGKFQFVEYYENKDGKQVKATINVMATRVNELAQIEADFSGEFSSQMKPTPDGEKKSVYSLNSSVSRMIYALSKVKNIKELNDLSSNYGYMPHLDYLNNPAIMGNVMINSLFDNAGDAISGNEIEMVDLSGAQYKSLTTAIEGLSHGQMTDTDKFIVDLFSMLSTGNIEAIRSGEKSTYYGIKTKDLFTYEKKKSKHLYIDTEAYLRDSNGKPITNVKTQEEVSKIMFKKLEGELRRIAMVNNGITKEQAIELGLDPKEAKNFYKNNVKAFDNGGKFDWFDDILESRDSKDAIKTNLINNYANKLTVKNEDGTITENNINDLLSATPEGKELKAQIEKEIAEYFKNLANRFKDDYVKTFEGKRLPLFLKELATKNLTEAQKELVGNDNSIINALMMSFAVNTALHSDDIIQIQFGDGFQFDHKKDEGTKRVPTYNSTGVIFPTDPTSVAIINKFYSRAYESKLIADKKINKEEVSLFNRVGNKAIIKESKQKAVRYNEYHDLFFNTLKNRYEGKELEDLLYGKGGTLDKPTGGIMEAWAEIKDGDGQGWVTFDYYRQLKAGENNWTSAQEAIYQKSINGEYISAGEIADVFPVYKLQYAGPLATSTGIYPIQSIDKFSLMPLIPSLIEGTSLETMHMKMMEQGVEYALFDSGAKRSYIKGSKDSNGDAIFNGNDTSNLVEGFQFTKNPFYVEYLKNQTEVTKYFKDKSTLSTQFRKIFNVGLYENGKAINKQAEENSEAVFKTLERLTSSMKRDLLKKMGQKESGNPQNQINLIEFVKKELAKQGFSKHEIDAIETDDGNVDLSTSPVAPRLERMLMAVINNKLVRLKTKGEPLVQVSSAFTQQRFTKPTAEQTKEYDDFGTNGLRGYVVDPVGELNAKGERVYKNTKAVRVKIALTENYEGLYNTKYFTKNKEGKLVDSGRTIGFYKKEGDKMVLDHEASFKRLNEMIKLDEWLNVDNNREKIQITGVRIPVQGPNSTEFAEVWDFLPPSAGTIIIIPAEIVAKSGGDFDVDKLTMYTKYITENGSLIGDTFDTPEALDAELKKAEEKLDKLKGGKLNIKNALADFRSEIEDASSYVNMSKEQLKNFTDKNNKDLLKALSDPENQKFLKTNVKGAYAIYSKQIKDFSIAEYDSVKQAIDELFEKDTELSTIYKKVSDLKEHKRNFTVAIQNTLVNNMVKVLQMPEMAFSLLLPNGTYLAKDLSDELKESIQVTDNEVNYTKSIKTGDNVSGISKGVSSTRMREYNYSKKKQQDNITGKNILGVLALDNTFNNLLNMAGTTLNKSIQETVGKGKTAKQVETAIDLFLKHNKTDGRISLSKLTDVDKKNQIADVLSQLMNGAVDVGKDAWVAYIQGNLEVIPKIAFLLEAGVPIKDVVYFVSNPITRAYVKTKQKANSKLAKLYYGKDHEPYKETSGFIEKYVKGINKTLFSRSNALADHIQKTGVKAFDTTTLRSIAKSPIANEGDTSYDKQVAGFLQYLYVEKLIEDYDFLKKTVDVDTNTTGDNYEVQAKISQIKEAENLKTIDPNTLKYMVTKSPIASFFIQDFAAEMFGERFFSFRANANLDEFLRSVVGNRNKMRAIKDMTGLKEEGLIPKYKNALSLFLFTTGLKKYKPGNEMYDGRSISELLAGSKVKSIEDLVSDYNKDKYLNDYKGDDNYRKRGLYPIPNVITSLENFIETSLERENLRKYTLPFSETLTKTKDFLVEKNKFKLKSPEYVSRLTEDQFNKVVYESMIMHKALLNTFNNHEMFSSGENTVAQKLINVINNYPDLQYKYGSLLERFALDAIETKNKANLRRNFKLKAVAEIDKPLAEDYNRMWKELANPSIPKLAGTKPENLLENAMISDFFSKLPMFAFLQSGMDPGTFSMNGIIPTDEFKHTMDGVTKAFTTQVLNSENSGKFLDSFLNTFIKNNSSDINGKLKGRGISYDIGMRGLLTSKDLEKISEGEDVPNLDRFIAEMNTLVNELNQSIETSEELGERKQVLADKDVQRFKEFVEAKGGVKPEVYFTDANHKWSLNDKGLYNLVDKATGEVFARDFNLETGFYEAPFKDETTQPSTSVKPTIDLSREWKGDLESRPVYTKEGVNTMRTTSAKPNEHFGNPFSEAGYGNTIKVDSIKEAVISYKKWLLGEMQDTDGIFKVITKVGDTVVLTFEEELNDIKVKITKFEKRGDNYFVEVLNNKGKTYSYLVDGTGLALNKKISIDFKFGVDKNIEAQRQWILDQINQGKLDGATLLYAGKSAARGQGMHPTALVEVVEEVRGDKLSIINQSSSETIDPALAKQKASAIKSIKDGIKNYKLDYILAEKGYDVNDFISNLEAATTKEEIINNIAKIMEKTC